MNLQNRKQILDKETVSRKIKRMALELAEQNADEAEIVLAGIGGSGDLLARLLSEEVHKLTATKITVLSILLNKKELKQIHLQPATDCSGRVVIVVDDVANTGKTLLYALKPFLDQQPKKIQTAVLVERSHKTFAVQTDYVGLSLSTTLEENIVVEQQGAEISGAYLH